MGVLQRGGKENEKLVEWGVMLAKNLLENTLQVI
jgi:hypothetical protein